MSDELRVGRCGAGYAVFQSGKRVSGTYGKADEAEMRAERILQAASRRQLRCMCCGQSFLSDGAHNRLCDPCRKGGHGLDRQMDEPVEIRGGW